MAVKYNSIAPSEIRTPPNNGQRPRSQCVRYSEVPLYCVNYHVFAEQFNVSSSGTAKSGRGKVIRGRGRKNFARASILLKQSCSTLQSLLTAPTN